MKTELTILLKTLVLSIGFICIGFTASVLMEGCATSTAGKLAQSEAVVIPTVNAAMGTWSVYVQSGKATPQQIADVEAAYNLYYNAQLKAEAALLANAAGTNVADQATAQAAVSAAETSLTTTITQNIK